MMEKTPLISIVMPVFNSGAYVQKSIQSVLTQTYTKWELLIVDDGSTDNSWEILTRWQQKDNRIKIFQQKNAGVSVARNTALKQMTGDFLCFLDSDDWLPNSSLEDRINKFQESDTICFVDGFVTIYDKNDTVIKKQWNPSFRGYALNRLLQLSSSCFFGPTWMIRVNKGYTYSFDTLLKHGEDLLFYIDIAKMGIYTFVEKPIYCYRDRPGSAMKNIKGLGAGYLNLRNRLKGIDAFSFFNRLVFEFRIKKIMFLTFFREGNVREAITFLFK